MTLIETTSPGRSFRQARRFDGPLGSIHTLLTRPITPYLNLATQQFDVGYLAHIIVSGSILVWALGNTSPSPGRSRTPSSRCWRSSAPA